jgi:hypothetical protein
VVSSPYRSITISTTEQDIITDVATYCDLQISLHGLYYRGFWAHAKPLRWNSFLTTVSFSGLHLADEVLSGCGDTTWSLPSYGRALFYTITSLTSLLSLGVASDECRPFKGALVASESLLGYFLLSLLTAMLFA